jgi:hypothetical protein
MQQNSDLLVLAVARAAGRHRKIGSIRQRPPIHGLMAACNFFYLIEQINEDKVKS